MTLLLSAARQALRDLMRPAARATTLTIVLTLGIAIGSMTSLFSIIESVVLHPLPYPDSDRLVRVQLTTEERQARTIDPLVATPWELYEAWQKEAASFERLGAILVGSAVVPGNAPNNAERIPTVAVTASVFALLGTQPATGRAFLAEEDAPGAAKVVILSHRFRNAYFSGDSSPIGRSITLDGTPYRVVGVMPAGFRVPLSVAGVDEPKGEVLIPVGSVRRVRRGSRPDMVGVIGRLRDGASPRAAAADIDHITSSHLDVVRTVQRLILRIEGDRDLPRVAQVVPLHDFIIRDARGMLWLLLGGVAAVILMSCANAANLLLARSLERRREFAVRRALGSTVARLVRPLMFEAIGLAGAAALVGTLLGWIALPTFVRLSGTFLPFVQNARLDGGVLGVVILVVLGMGALIGAGPAFVVARDSSLEALKDGTAGAGRSPLRRRLSDALVVGQIGLAVILMTVTALLTQSLFSLTESYRGYETENRVAVQFPVSEERYATLASQVELTRRIIGSVSAMPSIAAVAAATGAPALGGNSAIVSRKGGAPPSNPSATPLRAQTWAVTPNYFSVLGIPLRSGRALRDGDDSTAVVLDLAAADALFGSDNPIGMTVTWDKGARQGVVIGVVGNVEEVYPDPKTLGQQRAIPLHFYTLLGADAAYDLALIVKGTGGANAMLGNIRRSIAAIDPTIPIEQAGSLRSLITARFARERLLALLVMIFSALAVTIAAVGTYAVVADATARRAAEMGVRIALGAQPASILSLGLRRVAALAGIGALVGVVGSAAATRSLTHWLFEVSPLDPATFVVGVTLIVGVAITAGAIPALRATRIDPMTAFRRE